MDEVGRGTTPEDGIALAFACLHHLYFVNRARCLFATHFHVLADMAAGVMRVDGYGDNSSNSNGNSDSDSDSNRNNSSGNEGMACFCTDVAEEEVVAAATAAVDGSVSPSSSTSSSSASSTSPRSFSYVHRLRRGVNRKSHALKVAQVAGE